MTLQPIGDLARLFVSRRQMTDVQTQLNRASNEMTTGLKQDRAAHLNGDYTVAAAVTRDLSVLGALSRNVDAMATTAAAMQAALQAVDVAAQDLSLQILSPVTARDGPTTATMAAIARDAFGTAVGALNTRAGGLTVLAGTATEGSATVDAATLLAMAEAAAAGEVTVAGKAQAVMDWFDDPAGFAATGYTGGPPRPAVPVGPGDTAQLPQTALDPAQRRALAGLALAALSDRLAVGAPSQTAAALQRRAGEELAGNREDRAFAIADLGATEARLAALFARHSAETAALRTAESGLLSADPYEAATALAAREAQLQTIYAITGRLSRLTLTEYLR